MEEKKYRYTLRVSENEKTVIDERAKAKGMTSNAYIQSLIKKDCKELQDDTALSGTSVVQDGNEPLNRVWFRLTDEEINLLNKHANRLGLSVTEYVREVISKKSMVELKIQLTDLHGLIEEINLLSRKLNGIMAYVHQSEKVYDNDVKVMVNTFKDIDRKVDDIYLMERADRYKLYEEARKKVYLEIERNKLKKTKGLSGKNKKHKGVIGS